MSTFLTNNSSAYTIHMFVYNKISGDSVFKRQPIPSLKQFLVKLYGVHPEGSKYLSDATSMFLA